MSKRHNIFRNYGSGWVVYNQKLIGKNPRDMRIDDSMLHMYRGSWAFCGSFATKTIREMLKNE